MESQLAVEDMPKYVMRMSLNVLNHLGINLYSNIPAVLSEVVANAYDADATSVEITIGDQTITIKDDGHGMTLNDINKKFLYVGYQRRANNEVYSPKYRRKVMGRKGIGKLSLFSIANNIEVHTIRKNLLTNEIEKNGFILNRNDIISQIGIENDGIYTPKNVDTSTVDIDCGTRIIITDFKKNINQTENYLKRRLARRFTVIDNSENSTFKVIINGEPITYEDRNYFSKVQFLWLIGDEADEYSTHYNFKKINKLNGKIDATEYTISGWIGAVEKPSDLDQDGINNNKISVIVRGKMAQEDILESFNEGGIIQQTNALQSSSVDAGGVISTKTSAIEKETSSIKSKRIGTLEKDDPEKGKWGSTSRANGRKISATVGTTEWANYFRVTITVESTDPKNPLTGVVNFHLHPTFYNPNPVIAVTNGKAILELRKVYGAFTVGAEMDNGQTQLEYDLTTIPNAPALFLNN